MNDSHDRPSKPLKQLPLIHLPVGHSEEDESEERIESSAEKGEEISHAGNDFGEDEGDDPDSGHDGGPDAPADHGVAVCVVRLAHNTEVDELCANIGVDNTNHQCRHNYKGKGSFFISHNSEGTEGRGRGVLAKVSESNRRGNNE